MQEQIQGQEINLRGYINVIIKRKWIIITVFLIAVIATAIVSFSMPKVYGISMILEPGDLDSPKNIKAKIEEGAFNSKVLNALKLDAKKEGIAFKVFQPKDSTLVKISIEKDDKEKESGVKILDKLFSELSNSYKEEVDYEKAIIEKEISTASNTIALKKEIIKLSETQRKISDEKEKELLAQLKEVEENSKKLISQREALLTDKSHTDDTSLLLYSNAIQQNTNYLNVLSSRLAALKSKKEGMVTDLKNLEKEVEYIQISVGILNLEKDNIRNIKLLQKPEISLYPIKPKKRQNVMLAGAVSLMLGIFLAFFMEYWVKSNKQN